VGNSSSTQSTLVDRAIRAARLEDAVYEEVEHDREATSQAAIVVVVGALAGGIGSIGVVGVSGLLFGTITALLGWVIYAWLAYFVGTRFFATEATCADWGELARALGFAQAPRVLLVSGVIPVLGGLVGLVVFFWLIATTVVAIRAALDFSIGRAGATAVVALLPAAILTGFALAVLA
jgi:hypothetical protein